MSCSYIYIYKRTLIYKTEEEVGGKWEVGSGRWTERVPTAREEAEAEFDKHPHKKFEN